MRSLQVFLMAMQHTHFFYREQYYTPEQVYEATRFVSHRLGHLCNALVAKLYLRLVGGLKLLPVHAELLKTFPDIDATPPLSD